MNKPYFYIIEHIPSKKYYAGVRFAKNCNKKELLKNNGYITSSKIVHDLINKDGINSFIIRKIKEFDNIEDAILYENKFLIKVDAMHNDKFINLSNTINTTYNCKKLLTTYGVTNVFQIEWVKEKIKKTNLRKYGKEHHTQTINYKEKTKLTNLRKYGVTHLRKNKNYAYNQSKKIKGKNNRNFCGYYITPFGKFASRSDLIEFNDIIHYRTIASWCKKQNYLITAQVYNTSKFLKSNYVKEDIINLKTFKDIGFYFEYIDTTKTPNNIIDINEYNIITPHGKFYNYNEAVKKIKGISKPTLMRFCKESFAIISIDSYNHCKFLNQNFNIDIIGKSYKEIGFDYLGEKKSESSFAPKNRHTYITPLGNFNSKNSLREKLKCGNDFINTACKNNEKIIDIKIYNITPYLNSNYKKEDIIGKSYKEIGFGYIN